jgi:hypothetical protein
MVAVQSLIGSLPKDLYLLNNGSPGSSPEWIPTVRPLLPKLDEESDFLKTKNFSPSSLTGRSFESGMGSQPNPISSSGSVFSLNFCLLSGEMNIVLP